MHIYGLIGYPLGHSFSKKFFTEKFEKEGLNDYQYLNFELESITQFLSIFNQYPNIKGLNCTIPYKQAIMEYLDEIDEETKLVGAVNTIKPIKTAEGIKLKGYNTDIIGFERALKPMLKENHKKALILGTGGASKAIKHILTKLGIDFISASIENELFDKEIRYSEIDKAMIEERLILINATPLGTFPKVETCPDIPYAYLTKEHVLFDLVYNPEITTFMKKGIEKGATVKNGLEMLHGQALASWEIWNS
ncbi:MAG: shikimate dehydrogenase [Paludibacteraceae bacterium]|nr:shikimate dehydrogenase [Paludibacteraceae bacterium]MBN2787713.1 shikimate dehydrogenase [Paludibacteraceae bacterium]